MSPVAAPFLSRSSLTGEWYVVLSTTKGGAAKRKVNVTHVLAPMALEVKALQDERDALQRRVEEADRNVLALDKRLRTIGAIIHNGLPEEG